jgi:two-component system, LuxR family, response regulator FixJ
VTSAETNVAVVDDESAVRIALRRLLRLADFDVTLFESGEQFLASMSGCRPACVVLDVHMPGLSGIDVLQRLRSDKIELPVVCITASDDVELGVTVERAGAVRLLRKPFSSDELIDAVRTAIKR